MNNKAIGYKFSWVVLLVTSIVMLAANYAQFQMSPIAAELMDRYGLNASQYTSLFTSPMLLSIFLSLAAGVLFDKLGLKRVLACAALVTALGCGLRIFAASYAALYIATAMTGVSACFVAAGSAKILAKAFSKDKVGLPMGILISSTSAAMIIGMATTALFPSITAAFYVSTAAAIGGAILWMVIIPKDERRLNEAEGQRVVSVKEPIMAVLKSKRVWILGFISMFLSVLYSTTAASLPLALTGRGIDSVTAGLMSSIFAVGCLTGCIAMPTIASRLKNEKKFLFCILTMGAVLISFAWKAPHGVLLGASLLLSGALIYGAIPVFLTLPMRFEEIGVRYAGTAGGFTGTIQVLGTVIIPGSVLTPIAAGNHTTLFLLCGACVLTAALLLLFVKIPSKAR